MTVQELIVALEKWPKKNDIVVWVQDEVIPDFSNPIVRVDGFELNNILPDSNGRDL